MASAALLAARLNRLAAGIPAAQAEALRKAVLVTEGSIQIAAGRYAGQRISATKATYGMIGQSPGVVIKMASRKGHLLDHDTKAHQIGPKTAQALHFGSAEEFASGTVQHPGTKGKRFFERGFDLAQPQIAPLFGRSFAGAVAKAFV